MPLLQAFGQHTEAANWVLNYLLNKVEHNIKSPLYVDVSLIGDTVGLLISMVDVRHKYVYNICISLNLLYINKILDYGSKVVW